MDRQIKAISFTEEYQNEYNKLLKEGNASLLICELVRDHYNRNYGISDIGKDLKIIKKDLRYIKRKLED